MTAAAMNETMMTGNMMNDELTLDELNDVAGGSWHRKIAASIGAVFVGGALGFVNVVCPATAPISPTVAVGYGIISGAWAIADE